MSPPLLTGRIFTTDQPHNHNNISANWLVFVFTDVWMLDDDDE